MLSIALVLLLCMVVNLDRDALDIGYCVCACYFVVFLMLRVFAFGDIKAEVVG